MNKLLSAVMDVVDRELSRLADVGADALAAVLRRVLDGERDPALASGLNDLDAAVVVRCLDALADRTDIDRDAWRTLVGED